jgi:hypothetical protein
VPNTEFDPIIYFSGNVITVKGPLSPRERDEHVRRAIVFALVSQKLNAGAKAVTVAGEALLYPDGDTTTDRTKWCIVHPRIGSSIEPPPRPPGTHTHSYHYDLKETVEWYFETDMDKNNPLRKGPAFGTAILVTFMQNGSIETYAWSGWVNVEPISSRVVDPALTAEAALT